MKNPDPELAAKRRLYYLGVHLGECFIFANSLTPVRFTDKPRYARGRGRYLSDKRLIEVCPRKTFLPAREPIVGEPETWHFPASTVDQTAVGVIARCVALHAIHEHQLERSVPLLEPAASSLEVFKGEMLIQALRLFIVNPDLLRVGRPQRYWYLTRGLGLHAAVTYTWEEMLKLAHPKIKVAIYRWIARGAQAISRLEH